MTIGHTMWAPSPGTTPRGEVGRVLERRVVGRQHDVAHHRELGVDAAATVDRRDDRDLDVEQVEVELGADPAGLVEPLGTQVLVRRKRPGRIGGAEAVHERVAGAGEDHDAEVAVAGESAQRSAKALVGLPVEDELTAVGVDLEEEDLVRRSSRAGTTRVLLVGSPRTGSVSP